MGAVDGPPLIVHGTRFQLVSGHGLTGCEVEMSAIETPTTTNNAMECRPTTPVHCDDHFAQGHDYDGTYVYLRGPKAESSFRGEAVVRVGAERLALLAVLLLARAAQRRGRAAYLRDERAHRRVIACALVGRVLIGRM